MSTDVTAFIVPLLGAFAFVFGWDYLDKKFLLPWRAERMVKRISRDVKAGKRSKSPPAQFVIQFDSEGFSIRAVKAPMNRASMHWAEIEKVVVFKRDLFSIDMICMFLSKEDGTGIELDEEMGGWLQFAESLPKHLAGCQSHGQWFTEVAFPAFETKLTEIFRRNIARQLRPPLAAVRSEI